ncbi:uncharacterized protein L199_003773 [Kwoniella botswanensis]|uniref:uncharacterized protein n=1 Tax=Kwoniella botswanensis TaxID=1268659 RepID=UPI00315CED68
MSIPIRSARALDVSSAGSSAGIGHSCDCSASSNDDTSHRQHSSNNPAARQDDTFPGGYSTKGIDISPTPAVSSEHEKWVQKHCLKRLDEGSLDPSEGIFDNLPYSRIEAHLFYEDTACLPHAWSQKYENTNNPMKTNLIPLKENDIEAGLKRCTISEEYTTEKGSRGLLLKLSEFEEPNPKTNFTKNENCNLFPGTKIQHSFLKRKPTITSHTERNEEGEGWIDPSKFYLRTLLDPFIRVNHSSQYDSHVEYTIRPGMHGIYTDPASYGGLCPKHQQCIMRALKDSRPYISRSGDVYLELARATWKTAKMISSISNLSEQEQDEYLNSYIDKFGDYGTAPLYGTPHDYADDDRPNADKGKHRMSTQGGVVVIDNPNNEIIPQFSVSWAKLRDYQDRKKESANKMRLTNGDKDTRFDVQDTYQDFNTSRWGKTSTREIVCGREPYKRDRMNRFQSHKNMQNPSSGKWDTPLPFHLLSFIVSEPDDENHVRSVSNACDKVENSDGEHDEDASHPQTQGQAEHDTDCSDGSSSDQGDFYDDDEPRPDTHVQDEMVETKKKARRAWRGYRRMIAWDNKLRLKGAVKPAQSWSSGAWMT